MLISNLQTNSALYSKDLAASSTDSSSSTVSSSVSAAGAAQQEASSLFGALASQASTSSTAATSTASTSSTTSTASTSSTITATDVNNQVLVMRGEVMDLFSAVASGDINNAQSAYTNLTDQTGLSGSSSAGPSRPTQSNSDADSLSTALQQMGSALQSNNIGGAQKAMQGFLNTIAVGSVVNTTA